MKRLAAISVIGLSCALAFSLAACGDDTDKSPSKGPNPNDVKTEQVTEDEWKSALSEKKFYNVTCSQTITQGDRTEQILRKFDDTTGCILDREYTMIFSGGKCYRFRQVDGEWEHMGGSGASFDDYVVHWLALNVNAFDYDAFTYNNGKYTANNYTVNYINGETFEDGVILGDVSLKFENGRLVRCEYSFTYESDNVTNLFEFSDYGTTAVERPDVEIPDID